MWRSLSSHIHAKKPKARKTVETVFLMLFFLVTGALYSQNHFGTLHQGHVHDEKCGAVWLEKQLEKELGVYGSREYFESWVTDKRRVLDSRRRSARALDDGVRKIPVVVHVIHNGTPVGIGANIPDEQIFSQIETLNRDFRRLNPDAGDTPQEFLSVAGDARIEFVLAKQDPNGLPSNGINRVQGPRQEYPTGMNSVISQLAVWPPEDYLNIWVVPLQAPNIGYASFPLSDELPGLDFPATSRLTDGVTIDYRYFGTGGNAIAASRGRTTTHEVGHFFGLRHIWGDGPCGVDDFVEDTPDQANYTSGCPLTPGISCNSTNMIQNFMDYTADACMNLFTNGQVERMDVVLAFSPRRNSLLTSRGLEEPVLLRNNLAIEKILDPQDFVCTQEIRPSAVVVNYGANPIENADIRISVNGALVFSQTVNFNLGVGERDTLVFGAMSLPEPAGNFFEMEVLKVNGEEDPDLSDNYQTTSPALVSSTTLPHLLTAASLPQWDIRNPDGQVTWDATSLVIDGQSEELMYFNAYDYDVQGEVDYLISPSFDLSDISHAQLTFNLAYSPFTNDTFQETLIVAVSLDCGNTFEAINHLYNKGRESLPTHTPSSGEFIPNASDQFRREVINLSRYAGQSNVRVALIASNGFGNNIFVKDLAITREEEYRYSLRIVGVEEPLPVTAGLQHLLVLRVENTGNLPIKQFMADLMLNGRPADSEPVKVEEIDLGVGESMPMAMPNVLVNGRNRVDFRVYAPNTDQNEGNESEWRWHLHQDSARIASPWRQSFDAEEPFGEWIRISPERNANSWRVFPLADGTGNVVGLSSIASGDSYWLASPVFDLSNTGTAGVFFDWAGSGFPSSSGLSVELIASRDGGATHQVQWKKTGNELNSSTGGMPDINTRGGFSRQFVDLSDFTGSDQVRVYFRVSDHGASGGSIYLDNVELFLSNDPDPVDPGLNNSTMYPNPAQGSFNLVFNLEAFEDVEITIVSATGQVVFEGKYPMTLNQTYTFDSSIYGRGVYVVMINSPTVSTRKRLIVQ